MHDAIELSNPLVISVGGAIIVPRGKVDVHFLRSFNTLIRAQVREGRRFMMVAGGGGVCREYRDAGRAILEDIPDDDLDWLGIHATRLNGHLLRTIFKDIAHHRVIENYHHPLEHWVEPVVIGAGWKPGFSTDYCATYLAHEHGAKTIINLSNIEHVYDQDPKIHPDAQPLIDVSWDKMQEMLGTEWIPGLNAPFDPIACEFSRAHNMTVVVTDGRVVDNLARILTGRSFVGTVIR